MLNARAKPTDRQQEAEGERCRSPVESEHRGGRNKGACNQRKFFGPALTYSACGHLTDRHCRGIKSLEKPHLGEAQRQFRLPGRKQQIEHARIAIVKDVGEASGAESAPSRNRLTGRRGSRIGRHHRRNLGCIRRTRQTNYYQGSCQEI